MRSWTVEHAVFEGMVEGGHPDDAVGHPDIEVSVGAKGKPAARNIVNVKIGATSTKLVPEEAQALVDWLDRRLNGKPDDEG